MNKQRNLIIELDKLKSVYRTAYLSDGSRNENSAEHSWHLAITLMALKDLLPDDLNFDHAIRMALVHDVCEIGVGDVSVYAPSRGDMQEKESAYMKQFASQHGSFGDEVSALYHEFEAQKTKESIWVKVVDRLMPILLNLATEGRTWLEDSIKKSQVLAVNKIIFDHSEELGSWLKGEIDMAVQKGWLQDA